MVLRHPCHSLPKLKLPRNRELTRLIKEMVWTRIISPTTLLLGPSLVKCLPSAIREDWMKGRRVAGQKGRRVDVYKVTMITMRSVLASTFLCNSHSQVLPLFLRISCPFSSSCFLLSVLMHGCLSLNSSLRGRHYQYRDSSQPQ
jgi:hypothetical protein